MEGWLFWLVIATNAALTSYLWHIAKRGPRQKFRRYLRDSPPITPRHNPPSELKDGWGVTEHDKLFFADFRRFADVLNRWLDEPRNPWRVQELPDPELTGAWRDSPGYGRRYAIFYNQVQVGNLQIYADFRYERDHPNVHTEIDVKYARLFPFHWVSEFISAVADLTASGNRNEIRIKLHDSMLQQLWQIEYDYDIDARSSGGSVYMRFDGSAEHYFELVAALRD